MFCKSTWFRLTRNGGRKMSSSPASPTELPAAYSAGVQTLHWAMGSTMVASVGLVLAAQNTADKKLKGSLMYYHKSFGLLSFGLLFPRIFFRITSKLPGPVVGANTIEHLGATISHYLMYGFIFALPVTGVVMGALSGFGLPFFFTTFASIKKEPAVAKQAYELHKKAGQLFEYFLPLHVGGAFYHVLKGHTIFPRILGVLKSSPTPKVP